MLRAAEIRQIFLDFFRGKGHHIVPSAPIVVKNDPTLMFTNAGMNQFKDYFLGNQVSPHTRIADTQKCLRVSGKHNDLEEVGVDTYHHTMFEMLGNWSFGDYFKREAIEWSWELLTKVFKLDTSRLYVTVFEGDEKEGLPPSSIALAVWQRLISDKEHIVYGNKKDNFWEMGDTGPCGPCSEIHVDLRSDEERKQIPGHLLVNKDHPQVIEIWNNVFIQYNRKKDGSLEELPAKHVDTGMGFERLVRVLQNKTSNYDTDVFMPTIQATEQKVGLTYDGSDTKQAIAFRVIADHIRAIGFTIADGQLPSNTGAGYVIRRILRRAVRYYYSFLQYRQPLLNQLIPLLADQFAHVFPELKSQEVFVQKVVLEEEQNFLHTLEKGLKKMDEMVREARSKAKPMIDGADAFELYDTYGFPIDLTRLIAAEQELPVDNDAFETELQKQKDRSRKAAEVDTEDWVTIHDCQSCEFIGYDRQEAETRVWKYRRVSSKGKTQIQLALEQTPFYAESGGQVGDTGSLLLADQTEIQVLDTRKENDLIIHVVDEVQADLQGMLVARIDRSKRRKTQRHHTATHLLQAALQQVLGKHIAQKGSLNNADYLRFDFSHFAKLSTEEITEVEQLVNRKIRQNIPVHIRTMPKQEAMDMGAMALFGEKYGEEVRVVIIDPTYSIELCGGTHVGNTGELGLFKIISEGAIAAGVRRIEALAGCRAETWVREQLNQLQQVKDIFKNPKDLLKTVDSLQQEKQQLQKQLERYTAQAQQQIIQQLLSQIVLHKEVQVIQHRIQVDQPDALRKICLGLKPSLTGDYLVALGADIAGKPSVALMISDSLSARLNADAVQIIKNQVAPLIQGGGGGQKNLATAGGQNSQKLDEALQAMVSVIV